MRTENNGLFHTEHQATFIKTTGIFRPGFRTLQTGCGGTGTDIPEKSVNKTCKYLVFKVLFLIFVITSFNQVQLCHTSIQN